MRRAVLAGLLVLAGCGADPATSRLEPGSEAMVYAAAPATEVPVQVADPTRPGEPMDFPLAVGMRVRVLDDAAGPPDRPVRVTWGLLGGDARCRRDRLRPVR